MYLEYPLHQQDLNSITILDQCYRHPKKLYTVSVDSTLLVFT